MPQADDSATLPEHKRYEPSKRKLRYLNSCACRHLNHLVQEFVEHYHTERPHQGVGNVLLSRSPVVNSGGIVSRERLGGLLRHYERAA